MRQTRLRHHGRLRGDGDHGAGDLAGRTCGQRLGRIVVGYTTGGEPVTAEQLDAAGSMAVMHARGDQAEPAADAGEHARHRARRSVRQHRPRQLVGARRPDRHPRRRLPHHRGRVRRRHGRRAVLQHQVPRLRASCPTRPCSSPRCGRSRRTPGSTASSPASRCRRRCSTRARTTSRSARPTCASRSRTCSCTASPRSSPSTPSRPTIASEHDAIRRVAESMGARVAVCTHFTDGGAGAVELAEAVVEACDEPSGVPLPVPGRGLAGGEDRDRRHEDLRRGSASSTCRPAATPARDVRAQRLRPPAGVHRQDAPVDLGRRRAEGRADRARASTSARCGPRSAPASCTRSAARCARCPASAPTRRPR